MVGRRILAPEVGVRVPVPQPRRRPARGVSSSRRHAAVAPVGNDRDSLFEGFVSDPVNTCASRVGSRATKDTNGSAGPLLESPTAARAVSLSATAEVRPESRRRRPVRRRSLRDSRRRERQLVRRRAPAQLAHHLGAMQTSTSVVRFFEHHRWLLQDPRFRKEATVRLVAARHAFRLIRADAARAVHSASGAPGPRSGAPSRACGTRR